ncbi:MULTISPECIES: ExbD/TolR family protein [Flavobacterium]|uniref:Outer membrane transport energization protein ExbD n=1 Tax=Flavobacterium granuli TaxID=280093 RepID=A0A1M5PSW6_9FLAO|nr:MULTISPECIES: biopolymer transporter ExbD [Flavobacterium]PRZ26599.1 outer membrane transport energization protein ExbD [Flavobacterium granuli]UFH35890.1 biopolymer transporter ExbD [Flavobacterium sp. F-29]SHH04589.1 outer membrane transport energization protein ExbD [Flavobacterium granuli]
MAKINIKKNAGSTDMTAMCDVAFLLLTFFVMTSTAKIPEALPVDTPTSTVQTKLPETDLATLTVGKGKVFFDLKGKEVRIRTLELMGEKYGVAFSEEDKNTFSRMDDFGVPLLNLKQIIDMKAADRSKAGQPGIPADSLDNQLKDWIYNARIANIEVNDKELQVAIKGDAKEEYPAIRKVMDMLQDQKINSFSLVTGLRGKDF